MGENETKCDNCERMSVAVAQLAQENAVLKARLSEWLSLAPDIFRVVVELNKARGK